MEYFDMSFMYSIVAILWGVFSAIIQSKRVDAPEYKILIAFFMNSILCPFCMILAIIKAYNGSVTVE